MENKNAENTEAVKEETIPELKEKAYFTGKYFLKSSSNIFICFPFFQSHGRIIKLSATFRSSFWTFGESEIDIGLK